MRLKEELTHFFPNFIAYGEEASIPTQCRLVILYDEQLCGRCHLLSRDRWRRVEIESCLHCSVLEYLFVLDDIWHNIARASRVINDLDAGPHGCSRSLNGLIERDPTFVIVRPDCRETPEIVISILEEFTGAPNGL
jgi:hypothetical protein